MGEEEMRKRKSRGKKERTDQRKRNVEKVKKWS